MGGGGSDETAFWTVVATFWTGPGLGLGPGPALEEPPLELLPPPVWVAVGLWAGGVEACTTGVEAWPDGDEVWRVTVTGAEEDVEWTAAGAVDSALGEAR